MLAIMLAMDAEGRSQPKQGKNYHITESILKAKLHENKETEKGRVMGKEKDSSVT